MRACARARAAAALARARDAVRVAPLFDTARWARAVERACEHARGACVEDEQARATDAAGSGGARVGGAPLDDYDVPGELGVRASVITLGRAAARGARRRIAAGGAPGAREG